MIKDRQAKGAVLSQIEKQHLLLFSGENVSLYENHYPCSECVFLLVSRFACNFELECEIALPWAA